MTDDDLAAEYVLGTADDRVQIERRIATDSDFARLVDTWEQRFATLDDDFAEVPAPPLLPAIEARLFGRAFRRRLWSFGAGLIVASVAGLLLFAPTGDMVMTRLEAEGQPLVVEAAYSPSDQMLRMGRMAGPDAPAGQSYQGWVILPGRAPVSVGVMGDGMMEMAVALPDGTVFAVSLEPHGGSPTGQPTGPVILSATLDI